MALKLLKSISKSRDVNAGKIIPEKIKNVLIVRQHNQLGDMLCSLPLFASVKKKFVNAEITLVSSPDNYEILNSSVNKYIDNLLLYKKDSPRSLLNFYSKLKRKYDIGIVPSTVSFSTTSHLINHLSGAKIRTGVSKIGSLINESDFLLDIKKEFNWDKDKLHQWERNLSIVKQIGCELTKDEIMNVSLDLNKNELHHADKYFAHFFPNKGNIVIGIHPGAGKPQNRWNVKNFVKLARKLTANNKIKLLVTGGHMDHGILEDFKKQAASEKLKIIFLENEKIRNVAAILSKLDLYITNDTGTMHVAGFTKTKLLSLFGPTHGWEWSPKFENQICLQSKTNDINDINVEDVYKSAQKLLSVSLIN